MLQLTPQEFSPDTPYHHSSAHLLETAWLCLCDGTAISTLEGIAAATDATAGIRQARITTLTAARDLFGSQVLAPPMCSSEERLLSMRVPAVSTVRAAAFAMETPTCRSGPPLLPLPFEIGCTEGCSRGSFESPRAGFRSCCWNRWANCKKPVTAWHTASRPQVRLGNKLLLPPSS
jgi:hypothetical protein